MSIVTIESPDSSSYPGFKTEWWTPRLAGPLIAAAVVRLTLLAAALFRAGSSGVFSIDTASYLIPGRNLLLHGRFVADGVPDLLRTPGYSLFLAITSLAGLPVAAAINVLVSVFSVLIVWRLGRVAFDDNRIALLAAWLFAFEPLSVFYSVSLLSETLFLALLLLSLERLAVFLRWHSLRVLAVAGFWLAAATLVRPASYYLPVALALGLFLVLAREHGLRWKAPAVLLISVLPWLAAWQMRNWLETGYGRFSSAAEMNIYLNVAADVTARVEHRPFLDVSREMGYLGAADPSEQDYLFQPYLTRHPEQVGWSQGQRLDFMQSEANRILRAHPRAYAQASLMSLFELIFNPGAGNFDQLLMPRSSASVSNLRNEGAFRGAIVLIRTQPRASIEKAIFELWVLGLYLLAVRGVFRSGMRHPCLWLLLGVSLYFVIVTAAAAGPGLNARLRLPIMPVVCIFAAAGLQRPRTIAR